MKKSVEQLRDEHSRRAIEARKQRLKTKADWTHHLVDGVLVILDHNQGRMSVTNDMEQVLNSIMSELNPLPDLIIYRDSDLFYDQVEPIYEAQGSGFVYSVQFVPLQEKDLYEAVKRVKKKRSGGFA